MSELSPPISHQKINFHLWWFTLILMSINIGLFLIQITTGVDASRPSTASALLWGADYAPLTFLAEPFRLFSSMFFHFGMIHLMLNMWALYIFGSVAEQLFGRRYYIGLYLLSGLMGSLLSGYLDIQNSLQILQQGNISAALLPRVSAGASGAVMGLGASLTLLSLLPVLRTQKFILDKKTLLIMLVLNLFIGFMTAGINNAAHIGGMCMGAFLALCWYLAEKYRLSWLRVTALIFAAVLCFALYQYCLALVDVLQPFWSELLHFMQIQRSESL